jgi:hypothetical protein
MEKEANHQIASVCVSTKFNMHYFKGDAMQPYPESHLGERHLSPSVLGFPIIVIILTGLTTQSLRSCDRTRPHTAHHVLKWFSVHVCLSCPE